MQLVHRRTSGRLPTSTYDLVGDGGEVVGFCQIRHRPSCAADLPPEAGNHIYYEVAEQCRGRGYGRTLLGLALDQARRIGLASVRLAVDDDNPVSRRIVESYGAVRLLDCPRSDGRLCHLYEIALVAASP